MRAHSVTEPLGSSMARAHFDAPREFSVPLFRSLIDNLNEERRWVILALGAARPQIVELLSRFRCRLEIADLGATVAAAGVGAGDPVRFTDLSEAFHTTPDNEPVDIVFCWDFLNYLIPEQMTELIERIAARCRPDTFVHALIAYSDPLMLQVPGQFMPVDDGRLLSLSTEKPQCLAPRYSPEDLTSWMPGVTIERVRLLTNGMQEYLFRLSDVAAASGFAKDH